jgi:hypothetical protein
MEPTRIPLPAVIDPDRIHLEAEEKNARTQDKSQVYKDALETACDYAQKLWHELDVVRGYLLTMLPSDPRLPGPHRLSASPTGPDDEPGWQACIDTFARATSVLAGPKGDAGYGYGQARQQAQLRRTATNLRALQRRPHLEGHPNPEEATQQGFLPKWPDARTALSVAAVTLATERALAWFFRRPPSTPVIYTNHSPRKK